MNLKETLEWRYAAKAMNGEKISDEQRNEILDAMRMAPTSLGLQPFKFIVIKDAKAKADITPIFNNQGQIQMSDSVILIASRLKYDEAWIEDVVQNMASIRDMSEDQVHATQTRLKDYLKNLSDEKFASWATKQAYIALGFGLIAAANLEVDSTPMEGFDYPALDSYLQLPEKGYQSAVAIVLGKRDAEHDYLTGAKKVRLPMEDMLVEI